MTRIASIQLTTSDNLEENLLKLEYYIKQAIENGANHIFTPENSDIMLPNHSAVCYDYGLSSQKIFDLITNLSYKFRVCIHLGSIKVPASNQRYFNQSVTSDKNGLIVVKYNKIHLFDAFVGDGINYLESEKIQAGEKAVFYDFLDLKIGFTICYDLRFGYLYNILSDNDVDLIAVPAAFTVPTGQAHWEVLLRSRAIENCCYIVASAQCGINYPNRITYGNSMIIDPWGRIIDTADSYTEMIIYAEVDKKQRDNIKKKLNVIPHRIKNISVCND